MAVQAQYPSNVLLLNRSGQEGHEFSLPQQAGGVFLDQSHMIFNNGSNMNNSNNNNNQRKRGREVRRGGQEEGEIISFRDFLRPATGAAIGGERLYST